MTKPSKAKQVLRFVTDFVEYESYKIWVIIRLVLYFDNVTNRSTLHSYHQISISNRGSWLLKTSSLPLHLKKYYQNNYKISIYQNL